MTRADPQVISLSRAGPAAATGRLAVSVAIFAHNEQDYIRDCLQVVAEGLQGLDARAVVLANGCTDGTVEVAQAFCRGHANFTVVGIAVGDKANAWNVYVHDLAPEAQAHVFVDGDTLPYPGSFAAILRDVRATPGAHGIAGLPIGGRTSASWRENIVSGHGLPGPLYALSGCFVDAVRAARVRLPSGLIGDDVLVPILVRSDLLSREAQDPRRVAVCPQAEFTYKSLSYLRPKHWRLYLRRRTRNSLRHFQNQLLIPRIRRGGTAAIPADIAELYEPASVAALAPRRHPVDFWFDWAALRRIRAAKAPSPAGPVGPKAAADVGDA